MGDFQGQHVNLLEGNIHSEVLAVCPKILDTARIHWILLSSPHDFGHGFTLVSRCFVDYPVDMGILRNTIIII